MCRAAWQSWPMARGGRGAIRVGLPVLAGLALLALLAQLLGPPLAADRISSRVGRYGRVGSVSVSAWPAVELLWGHADTVRVRAAQLSIAPHQAAALLWEGRGAQAMDVDVARLRLDGVQLEEAGLRKQGSRLAGTAYMTVAAVRAALPRGVSMRLLESGGGRVVVAVGGGLFGLGAAVRAVAEARGGQLVARPLEPSLGGLQLTLFSDPHVYVEGVGARAVGDPPRGYALTIAGRLR